MALSIGKKSTAAQFADDVGIVDVGGNYSTSTVEAVLAELPSKFQGIPLTCKTVSVNGGAQYTDIYTALAAITDASELKPYLIEVAPGVYDEHLTLKDWVFIKGSGKIVTKITADDGLQPTVEATDLVAGGLIDLSVINTVSTGENALDMTWSGLPFAPFQLSNVFVDSIAGCALSLSSSVAGHYINCSHTDFRSSSTIGVHTAKAELRLFENSVVTGTPGLHVDNAICRVYSGSEINSTGTSIHIENSSELFMNDTRVAGDTGLLIQNSTAILQGNIFSASTWDLDSDNSTLLMGTNSLDLTKVRIINASPGSILTLGKIDERSGTAAFANATSVAVSFSIPFFEGIDQVLLTPDGNVTYWVTGKTNSGFTINTDSAFTGNIDWLARGY